MPNIHDNIDIFTRALKHNLAIKCDENSEWRIMNPCESITSQLYSAYCKSKDNPTLTAFIKALDNLEKTPVEFKTTIRTAAQQREMFSSYLKAAETIEYKLQISPKELNTLRRKIIGLQYRIEKNNGGLNKNTGPNFYLELFHLANDWKQNEKLYPDQSSKQLTKRDIDKLLETCKYPEFIKLLMWDKALCSKFFKWSIRDNNPVDTFIEFPATSDTLHINNIDKRTGLLNPDLIKIKKSAVKDITLPFYDGKKTNYISILDESKIINLNNNLSLSLQKIYQVFFNKREHPGYLEFFKQYGIMNWASFEYGPINPDLRTYKKIDIARNDWWDILPKFDELSKSATEKRYDLELKDNEWVQCIRSTKETLDYRMLKRHGYLEVAIPLKNGNYGIFPFGKYPTDFPTSTIGLVRLIPGTTDARLEYPDENVFYSHRQHAMQPEKLSQKQGQEFIEKIRIDIEKTYNNKLNFQMAGKNCAEWAESKAVVLPETKTATFFKMPATEMQPTDKVLDTFVKQPHAKKTKLLLHTLGLLANIDGRTVKVNGEEVYTKTEISSNIHEIHPYRPGHLNNQILEGKLPGKVFYGN